MSKEASSAFGPIDVLFNNAGLGPAAAGATTRDDSFDFWDVSWDTLQKFHAVNSTAAVFLAGLLVPTMIDRGWGRIINDTTSLRMMLSSVAYGGSKASLEAHTSAMAYDLEGTGVTANVLVPGGPAVTRMSEGLGLDRSQMLDPQVMAAPSVWLASPASDGINGCRFVAALWDPASAGSSRPSACDGGLAGIGRIGHSRSTVVTVIAGRPPVNQLTMSLSQCQEGASSARLRR